VGSGEGDRGARLGAWRTTTNEIVGKPAPTKKAAR
jgi:hypothetical protein